LKSISVSVLGLAIAMVGFVGAGFVFLRVQISESYPFHSGVYGTEYLFPWVTYTVALEIFGALAAAGIFIRIYSVSGGTRKAKSIRAIGTVLLILGAVISVVVYAETRLVWGEILPGVHLWQGLPGGGGYPWGTEQVAYNTCFVRSGTADDCIFLNYNELFWISVLSAIAGFIIRSRATVEDSSDERAQEP
jgi:hypothetical protein